MSKIKDALPWVIHRDFIEIFRITQEITPDVFVILDEETRAHSLVPYQTLIKEFIFFDDLDKAIEWKNTND